MVGRRGSPSSSKERIGEPELPPNERAGWLLTQVDLEQGDITVSKTTTATVQDLQSQYRRILLNSAD